MLSHRTAMNKPGCLSTVNTLRHRLILNALGRVKSCGLGMGGKKDPLHREGSHRMLPLRDKLCSLGTGSSGSSISLLFSG